MAEAAFAALARASRLPRASAASASSRPDAARFWAALRFRVGLPAAGGGGLAGLLPAGGGLLLEGGGGDELVGAVEPVRPALRDGPVAQEGPGELVGGADGAIQRHPRTGGLRQPAGQPVLGDRERAPGDLVGQGDECADHGGPHFSVWARSCAARWSASAASRSRRACRRRPAARSLSRRQRWPPRHGAGTRRARPPPSRRPGEPRPPVSRPLGTRPRARRRRCRSMPASSRWARARAVALLLGSLAVGLTHLLRGLLALGVGDGLVGEGGLAACGPRPAGAGPPRRGRPCRSRLRLLPWPCRRGCPSVPRGPGLLCRCSCPPVPDLRPDDTRLPV